MQIALTAAGQRCNEARDGEVHGEHRFGDCRFSSERRLGETGDVNGGHRPLRTYLRSPLQRRHPPTSEIPHVSPRHPLRVDVPVQPPYVQRSTPPAPVYLSFDASLCSKETDR